MILDDVNHRAYVALTVIRKCWSINLLSSDIPTANRDAAISSLDRTVDTQQTCQNTWNRNYKMKTTLIFVVVIGMAFLANAGRKCYLCDGKECENGLGKVFDCSTFACGVSYDISGSTVAKGAVDARYCMQPLNDSVVVKPEYACDFWKSPTAEILSDGCYCDTDLCNGEEPSCETRSIQHPEVSEVLADKCAPEIAKRKAAA